MPCTSRRLILAAGLTSTLFAGAQARAQERPAAAIRAAVAASGSVSGQVVLADTRQPGRFATVLLLSAENLPLRLGQPERESGSRSYTTTANLLGEYTIPQVEPGEYYIVGSAPGYVSPYAFNGNQDQAKLRAALDRVAARVAVQANGSSRADVELTRGASISGLVRYDDGSPATGLQITLLTRDDANRAWHAAPVFAFGRADSSFTDDEGHWRRAGLAAGTYTVSAALPVLRSTASGDQAANHSRFGIDTSGNLSIYLGGGSDTAQAKAVTVRAGEQVGNLELIIPTQGLNRVEGTVIAGENGQSLAGLRLTLQLANGNEPASRTTTSGDDGRFAFSNVPGGQYTLRFEGGLAGNKAIYKPAELPVQVTGSVRDLVVQAVGR